jgi:hypothetical protein
MCKLLTPPHAHATTSAEFENATDSFDDASTVLVRVVRYVPF